MLGLLLTTPALANGVLPFDGAFGNDQGCALYSDGQMPTGQGEFFLLTANAFSSYPVHCDFISSVPSGALGILATADCHAADGQGDRETLQIISHGAVGYGLKPHGGPEYGPWPACPPKKPGVPGEVSIN